MTFCKQNNQTNKLKTRIATFFSFSVFDSAGTLCYEQRVAFWLVPAAYCFTCSASLPKWANHTYVNLRPTVRGQACSCRRKVNWHVESLLPYLYQMQKPGLNTIRELATSFVYPLKTPSAMAKDRLATRESRGETGSNELNSDQIIPRHKCEEEGGGL